MIVIINTSLDTCFHTKFKSSAADFIGVSRRTIHRWIKIGKKSEKYNHLKIYLDSEII